MKAMGYAQQVIESISFNTSNGTLSWIGKKSGETSGSGSINIKEIKVNSSGHADSAGYADSAGSATKATNDGDNLKISTTYAKKSDLYNSLVPFLYTYQQNGYIEITIRHRVVYLEVRLVAVGPELSIRDTAQIDVSIMPNLAYYTKHCTAASSFVDNSHYNKIMFLLPICKACITSMGNEKFIEWHCLSTTSGAYTLYTSGINSIGTTTKIKITPQNSNMETVSYTRAIQGYYEQ